MNEQTIATVQGFGFDVYMRKPDDSWLLFTDGKRIGYLQYAPSEGSSISTVHKPNRHTGTGFQIERHIAQITKDQLDTAFNYAPHWASSRDIASVVKWRDIAEYINADTWNAEYKKLEMHV